MLPLKSTKNKFIISSILLLLVSIGYGVFFSLIISTNKALATIDYELDVEIKTESQLNDLDRILKNTEEDRALLNTYFLEQDGVVDFINNIESSARKVGVDSEIVFVDTDNTEIADAIDNFEDLNIEIKVKGDWSQVFHFAQVIDSIPHHLSLEKMSIINTPLKSEGGGPSSDWEGVFSFSILVNK